MTPAFQNILVPIGVVNRDNPQTAPGSLAALDHARRMALQSQGTVSLLYVIPIFVMHMAGFNEERDPAQPDRKVWVPMSAAPGVERIDPEKVAHDKLEESAREQHLVGEVPYKIIIRVGDPAKRILEVLREEGSDLAILAKRRKSFLEEMFVGSVTAKVLHDATCSVLVLHV